MEIILIILAVFSFSCKISLENPTSTGQDIDLSYNNCSTFVNESSSDNSIFVDRKDNVSHDSSDYFCICEYEQNVYWIPGFLGSHP
jgi:hypothetical protein